MAPGTLAEVEFTLLYHPKLDYTALVAGAEIVVHEGPKVVATGTILEWIE